VLSRTWAQVVWPRMTIAATSICNRNATPGYDNNGQLCKVQGQAAAWGRVGPGDWPAPFWVYVGCMSGVCRRVSVAGCVFVERTDHPSAPFHLCVPPSDSDAVETGRHWALLVPCVLYSLGLDKLLRHVGVPRPAPSHVDTFLAARASSHSCVARSWVVMPGVPVLIPPHPPSSLFLLPLPRRCVSFNLNVALVLMSDDDPSKVGQAAKLLAGFLDFVLVQPWMKKLESTWQVGLPPTPPLRLTHLRAVCVAGFSYFARPLHFLRLG
jgi:hypothetical protein